MEVVIGRIVIDDVRPRVPGGYPAKATLGHPARVSADVFRDGHDPLAARVRWRAVAPGRKRKPWAEAPMAALGNDRWEAWIEPTTLGLHELVVDAWTEGRDPPDDLRDRRRTTCAEKCGTEEAKRTQKTQVVRRRSLTTSASMPLWVDRERALVGAWYELFPRSEGGFAGAARRLEAVAAMGFDVVYLPPVHPVGHTSRKGADNTLAAGPGDPGSPWAIGSEEGGHTAIDPGLGTVDDFDRFVAAAAALGLEVALDYTLQCSPDHPWVGEHPEWFHHRPDGSIKFAENPPKQYQDIYPLNFWPPEEKDRQALWDACKEVLDFWIGRRIRIFRVDNPHTKPLAFWEWVIPEVQADHPDVVFLAEAFTRPKMMAKLAAVGFSQSYTYFTWRTTKQELTDYLTELAHGPAADYMRPNLWPNTPDILSGPLRHGPLAAFKQRLVLAATMSPSYGIYSGYELGENEPLSDENEEYRNSEKYQVKRRDWDRPDSLAPWVTRLNEVRRRHPAFADLDTISFHPSGNDQVLVYSKRTRDGSDVMLVVVNLDPHHPQEDVLELDLGRLGLPWDRPYEAHDELTGTTFTWDGPRPYVRLDPAVEPAHLLHLRTVG